MIVIIAVSFPHIMISLFFCYVFEASPLLSPLFFSLYAVTWNFIIVVVVVVLNIVEVVVVVGVAHPYA